MPKDSEQENLSALLQENRKFPPSAEFRQQANWSDPAIYERAAQNPEAFWAAEAKSLDWFTPWQKVLEWNAPWAKWFVGGKLNVAYNCVDRHAHSARRNKAAIIWEGEPGDSRVLTYGMLEREVNRFANALRSLGVTKATASPFTWAWFRSWPSPCSPARKSARRTASSSADFPRKPCASASTMPRPKWSVTGDGAWRRGSVVPLKASVDEALRDTPTVEKVVVVGRVGEIAGIQSHNAARPRHLVARASVAKLPTNVAAEPMDAEDMLFVLYTSGTTGKPKGIVHTTGGYLVGRAATHRYVFDIKEDDVYWCTADIGWVTGHSYIVYGPLANGATSLHV